MAANAPIPYYSTRGTLYYTPAHSPVTKSPVARLPLPPCRPRQRRPHSIHITRLPAGFIPLDLRPQPPHPPPKEPSRFSVELRKLASRENAKRVLGTVLSPFTSSTASNSSTASSSIASPTRSASSEVESSARTSISAASADPTTIYSRRAAAAAASTGLDDSTMSRPSLVDRGAARREDVNAAPIMPSKTNNDSEKPVCSGSGVAVYIHLAEPVIFLAGFDHDGTTRDSPSNSTAILRGKLQLNVTKAAKIKAVTLKFTGRARTEWPEGIPPEKSQTFEEESLRTQVLPFFNALYEGSETGYGTYCNYSYRDKSASSSVTSLSNASSDLLALPTNPSGFSIPTLSNITNRSSRSSTLSSKEQKRLSLQSNQTRSFQKGDSPFGPTPQQKGYKIFHPGVYEYSFELPIDNNSPESVKLQLASVTWMLEAIIERAGTFKPDLLGYKEIPVIRTPSEDSLELVEPISINKVWEDQLSYEIMIAGKSFPLGSKIPIAFKLTPLAKVQVHKIRIYISEGLEYYTNNKRVARKDPVHKVLYFEKEAGKPVKEEFAASEVKLLSGGELGAEQRAQAREHARVRRTKAAEAAGLEPEPVPPVEENLLGDINLGLEHYWSSTEMEMNVQLPTCEMMEKDKRKRLIPDCTWKCVSVHHWIKIIMRVSRLDTDDPTGKKRRHFEISIDSPFTILNCRATLANMSLPEYSGSNPGSTDQQRICGCPNAASTNHSANSSSGSVPTLGSMPAQPEEPILARPPQAHLSTGTAVQRPIHMLRAPSFNPPPFDADDPPPPMAMPTPPPQYDNLFGTASSCQNGLADYFARLSDYDDQTDEDDSNRAFERGGRVNVPHPRTPGGRIARSMDIDREFMFNPEAFNNALRIQPSTAVENDAST